jgi:hypothetical protein
MSETDVLRISQELGQDPYQVIDDFPSSPVFQRLKSLGLFRDIYERSRALQHSYALEYLSSFFPNSSLPSVVALVDIGWKGTIQDNIRAFLPEDCLLQGFYVGLVAPGALSDMNRKEGLLFSSVHKHSLYFEAFAETCPLFEIFLSAQHPGTVSYERSHAGVQPVFGVDDSNDEVRRVINGIQDNIFTTFLEMLGAFAQGHVDEGEFLETVAKRHSRMGLAPSEAELNLVASIEHFENFGLFNHTSFTLPKKVGLRRSARSYLQYVRDPSSVLNSSLWPALSLYREGLSSLLPRYAKRRTKEIFGASGV